MQKLIQKNFIRTDIDKKTQVENLINFAWGLKTGDLFYKYLFNDLVSELVSVNDDEYLQSELAEQLFPYLLAMQSYANSQSFKDKLNTVQDKINLLEMSADGFEGLDKRKNTNDKNNLWLKTNDLIQGFINGKQDIYFESKKDFKNTTEFLKNMLEQNSIYFKKAIKKLASTTLDEYNDNIIKNHIQNIAEELNKWSPDLNNLIELSEKLIKKTQEKSKKENLDEENNNVKGLQNLILELEAVKDLTGFKKFWDNCKEFFKSFTVLQDWIGKDRLTRLQETMKVQQCTWVETTTATESQQGSINGQIQS